MPAPDGVLIFLCSYVILDEPVSTVALPTGAVLLRRRHRALFLRGPVPRSAGLRGGTRRRDGELYGVSAAREPVEHVTP